MMFVRGGIVRSLPISLVAVLAAASPACAVSSRGFAVMNRAPSAGRALAPATHPLLPSGTKTGVFGRLKPLSDLALALPADGITGLAPAVAHKALRAPAAPPAFAGAKTDSSMGHLGSLAPMIEGSQASGDWRRVMGGLQALWERPPQASRGSASSSRCTGFCGTFKRDRVPGGGGSSQGLPPGGGGGGSPAGGARERPGLKLFFQKGAPDYDREVLERILLQANPYRLERFLRRLFRLFPQPINGMHLRVLSIDHLRPPGEKAIDVIEGIEYTILLRSGPGKQATLYGNFKAKVNLRTKTLVLNAG